MTLAQRFDQDMQLARLSESTRRIYASAVRDLENFHGGDANGFSQDHLRAWVAQLDTRGLSAQRRRQLLAAVTFLFRKTLARPEVVSFISWPRDIKIVVEYPSREEIRAVLKAFRESRFRVLFATIYATALRLGEACLLRTSDIHADRSLISIRNCKLGGERYVMLSPQLLLLLRSYWRVVRPAAPWLFASRNGAAVSTGVARRALSRASEDAGLRRRLTPHQFRHAAATHMLEDGVDIRLVQAVLGHASIRSTVRYTHVSPDTISRIRSPFDQLLRRERTG